MIYVGYKTDVYHKQLQIFWGLGAPPFQYNLRCFGRWLEEGFFQKSGRLDTMLGFMISYYVSQNSWKEWTGNWWIYRVTIPYMDPMVDNCYYQTSIWQFFVTSCIGKVFLFQSFFSAWVTLKHLLLMVQKSCDHQLRLVVYHPIIYRVLHMPGG